MPICHEHWAETWIAHFLDTSSSGTLDVYIGVEDFHPSRWRLQRREAELGVQPLSVGRDQAPAPQTLKLRMPHNTFHQPLGKSAATMTFQNKHVANVGIRRKARNYA